MQILHVNNQFNSIVNQLLANLENETLMLNTAFFIHST